MNKINRVLIAGGTHGNELTGIYLVKKFEQNPELVKRASFETVLLLGNPRAMTAGLRYIDQDLNRCFNLEDRQTEDVDSAVYEVQRAIEIREQFGLAGRTPVDFAIDIHSTSANAGMMLILDNSSQFVLRLAAHLSTIEPALKVYSSALSGREQDALRSLAKYRLCIEVGPICHGTLHAELFTKTEALIQAILSYLDQSNQADIQLGQQQLTLYQYCRAIDYPRNSQGE
ncbi:MAG: aspartoacylase, partial [Leptolyngbya sp. SIO4C5]|nr:aspartoacylase [Leptolyngbya sp. SIO4C5]